MEKITANKGVRVYPEDYEWLRDAAHIRRSTVAEIIKEALQTFKMELTSQD